MLQSAPADYLNNLENAAVYDLPPAYPVYYFFYGTLTNPHNLQRILDPPEAPTLRSAQIIGYRLARWGDYPALIDGEQGQVVSGYAFLVWSEEQARKLMHHETNAYKVAPCRIFFTDGDATPAEVSGKVFVYAGDAQALLEQRSDRRLWELQMRGKLR